MNRLIVKGVFGIIGLLSGALVASPDSTKKTVVARLDLNGHSGERSARIVVLQSKTIDSGCYARKIKFYERREFDDYKFKSSAELMPYCPDRPSTITLQALVHGFAIHIKDVSERAGYSNVRLLIKMRRGSPIVEGIEYEMQRADFNANIFVKYVINVDTKTISKFNMDCFGQRTGLVYKKKVKISPLLLDKLDPYYVDRLIPDDNSRPEDIARLTEACDEKKR